MTALRTAAQQALEALEKAAWCVQHDYQPENMGNDWDEQITALRAALAEPEPNTLHGWVFKRNADGSVGIFAPPPKPGESRRTSDCVGPQDRDLHELLGKLADHMAALPEPVQEPVAWMYSDDHERMLKTETFCTVYSVKVGSPDKGVTDVPLYAAPPQRKPPATIDEMFDRMDKAPKGVFYGHDPMTIWMEAWRAAEQHHGIKEEK